LPAYTKSIVQTHTVCTTQVDKKDKTERFTTALEAEAQGYTHFLNRKFCNGVGVRTTGLQTHSYHDRSLTRNTWYNTTAKSDANIETGRGQVKYECVVAYTPSNEQTPQCPSTQ